MNRHTRVTTRSENLDPGSMAPHADRAWVESFVIEQRILGVPGDRIGDALVTVEAHVRESGESVGDAFGDPRAYARELSSAQGGDRVTVDTITIVGSVLGLLSILLVPRAVGALLAGTEVSVTLADLVLAGVLLGLLVVLFTAGGTILRHLVDHRWTSFVIAPVLVAVFVAVLVSLRGEVASPSAALVGGLGVLAMLGQMALLWRQPADEIVPPGANRAGGTVRNRRLALLLGLGPVALMCLMTWVLHRSA